jgi:HSP20 family protein
MTQVKFINRPGLKQIDDFWSDFFNRPSVWSDPSADVTSTPAANVFETAHSYQLEINAPGRNKEDFNVHLEKDLLTVSFVKKEEIKQEEGVKSIRREFSVNNFKRSFSLDDKIDAANIQAKYENGVLKIELPKKEEVKPEPKQITIS